MRFEIEELKDKKLLELQEIAQTLEIQKFKQLKKTELIEQILGIQAAKETPLDIRGSVTIIKKETNYTHKV